MPQMPIILTPRGDLYGPEKWAYSESAGDARATLKRYGLETVTWYLSIRKNKTLPPQSENCDNFVASKNLSLVWTGKSVADSGLEEEIRHHLQNTNLRRREGIDLIVAQPGYLPIIEKVLEEFGYTPLVLNQKS